MKTNNGIDNEITWLNEINNHKVYVTGSDVFKPAHDCPVCGVRIPDELGETCSDSKCNEIHYDPIAVWRRMELEEELDLN